MLESERGALEGKLLGANRLVPLSELFHLLNGSNGSSDAYYGLATNVFTKSVWHGFSNVSAQRLGWSFHTWLKLWFWALPARRVVVLDNDMLVYRNLTWLFDLPLPAHRVGGESALLASLACPKQQAFNSGVMVIAPSLTLTVKLQRYAAAAFARRTRGVKQFKYCEITVSDQSLLNNFFRGRWGPLPARCASDLNFDYRSLHSINQTVVKDNISVLHFKGMRVKPWACERSPHCARDPTFARAVRAWKQECSSFT